MKDQGNKVTENKATKIAATLLIILSGLILYLDKIFVLYGIELQNNHGWNGTEQFIWSFCQTISPMLLMAGCYLKPHYPALIVPLFCYVLQMYFVLDSSLTIDRPLTWLYILVTMALTIFLVLSIRFYLLKIGRLKALEHKVMKDIIKQDDKLLNPDNEH